MFLLFNSTFLAVLLLTLQLSQTCNNGFNVVTDIFHAVQGVDTQLSVQFAGVGVEILDSAHVLNQLMFLPLGVANRCLGQIFFQLLLVIAD